MDISKESVTYSTIDVHVVPAAEVRLVDVREQDEWDAGHAPQAIHVPLGVVEAGWVPVAGLPLALICRSGARSGRAAAELAARGVPVSNVAGGMRAWHAASLTIVSTTGSPGVVL